MSTELLTPHEAAEHLQVSPRTLEGWRVKGGGPRFVRLPGRVRYRRADLEAWSEAHVRASTSDSGRAN